MPIYEYRCPDCGCEFEQMREIDSRHEGTCIHCGSLAKLLTSLFSHRVACPLTIMSHDGKVLGYRPRGAETTSPDPPKRNLGEI